MPQITTWDRRLYFPSEGRRAEDLFRPKNPTVSAGFEPANFGTKSQHATPRPPKPINIRLCYTNYIVQYHPIYLRLSELLCAVGEIITGFKWGSSNPTQFSLFFLFTCT